MENAEIIDDFVEDISSWSSFYILADDESKFLANEFHEMLKGLGISFVFIESVENEFDGNADSGDVLLAISQEGRQGNIISLVKDALAKDVNVYSICSDLQSPLALISCEIIPMGKSDEFKESVLEIFDYICEKLSEGLEDEGYSIKDPAYPAPVMPSEKSILSPFSGIIVDVKVEAGDAVKIGDVLCVIEAMKMENNVCSDRDGVVGRIFIENGTYVSMQDVLMDIK
jgi:hypothetical protein